MLRKVLEEEGEGEREEEEDADEEWTSIAFRRDSILVPRYSGPCPIPVSLEVNFCSIGAAKGAIVDLGGCC
jgi:hypothetical protein